MLPATDDEKAEVTRYYLSQSPQGTEVSFLQKVYSESIMSHRHDVWDVHASDGRWWVITNPTNLYSQTQFPNLDLAVTFHMGLCLRIPRTQEKRKTAHRVMPFDGVIAKMNEISDALSQAQTVADFQAVGMRTREALLAFVGASQDVTVWTTETPPKKADFRAWTELICNSALSGGAHKERRHLFKTLLLEAWVFANWLTHSHSATWHDAEAAQTTAEHILGLGMSLVLRHIRDVPEQCPACGSFKLNPEEGWWKDEPSVVWERPVCDDCGWTGKPAPVGEQSEDVESLDGLFTRIGGDDSKECVMPAAPLTKLLRPGDM